MSSEAHKGAKGLDFDDLNNDKSYTPWSAYCRSKLANILFTRELSKKLDGVFFKFFVCYINSNIKLLL